MLYTSILWLFNPPCAISTAFRSGSLIHLLEANILGVLMKALTAHVEAVLADQTVTVAEKQKKRIFVVDVIGFVPASELANV